MMTAKEFLEQANKLERTIKSKIEQILMLNELATKCTPALSGMPHSQNNDDSCVASTVSRIVDLQEELSADIDELIEVKRDIMGAISELKKPKLQLVLELRYLCYKTWEQITDELDNDPHYLRRLRNQAISELKIPEKYLREADGMA